VGIGTQPAGWGGNGANDAGMVTGTTGMVGDGAKLLSPRSELVRTQTEPNTQRKHKGHTEKRFDFRRFFRTGVGVVAGLEKSRLLSPDWSWKQQLQHN